MLAFRDVTERRLAEERQRQSNADLAHSNEELHAANEELEAFAYSASHDLRTPVRHVKGFSELARKAVAQGNADRAVAHMQVVEQAAERMSALIDAMLHLSRSTRQELRPGPVDLNVLLERAQADVATDLHGRTVQWVVSPLPTVQGDATTLQQVMTNLVSNAVKFTRDRDPARIEVWAEGTPDHWTVQVRDNGAGFDATYRDKLFGVFQRLHNQRDFEGTGVGLATVRRIVLRHGGRVFADGEVGRGATFGFTLPR